MTFRDRWRQASWRGIPFEPRSASFDLGRHVVMHEFPLRDEPFAEDLARKARSITVEGLLSGDDFDLDRNRMISAIEKQGQGTLVLPTFGRVVMQLADASISETYATEKGQATFTLTLGEAGSRSFPEVDAQPATTIETTSADVNTESKASFSARFSVDDVAGWVETSAAAYLNSSALLVEAARLDDTWTVAEQTAIDAAAVAFAATDLSDPDALADAMVDYVGLMQRWSTYATLMVSLTANPTASSIGSNSWDQDNDNEFAIRRLFRRAALAGLAVAATTDLGLVSRDDAEATRDLVVGYYDRELAESDVNDDAETFAALYLARLAFIRWIEAVELDLVPIRDYEVASTMPVLLIAQDLYGDATRAEEIIERNAIEHPLFVPGGTTLKVLAE